MTVAEKRKMGLGRGLSSLLGDAATGHLDDGSPMPATLPIELLKPGRFQPRSRMAEDGLEDLARSVREQGVLQPILVRRDPDEPDLYEIVAGERRWRAAQRAGLHQVPVILRELSDADSCEIALVENLQREDLSAIEEAEAYQRLISEFAHTQDDLARRVGKSRPHVTNTLRLLSLPDSVQAMVRTGTLTAGQVRPLVGVEDAEALAREVADRGLNARQVERLAKAARRPATARPRSAGKDADMLALEHDLSNRLGLSVELKVHRDGGALVIHYQTLDQLDTLLARLSAGPGPADAG